MWIFYGAIRWWEKCINSGAFSEADVSMDEET